jgi:ribosome-associated protein
MIPVAPGLWIDENEIQEHFIRASGPGGQNVNKVATAVQLRFNVRHSPSLTEDIRSRLAKLAGRRMTEDGVLIIEAKTFRTQGRNREDALERLIALIRAASEPPKTRHKTRPTLASQQRRLKSKLQRGDTKKRRQAVKVIE